MNRPALGHMRCAHLRPRNCNSVLAEKNASNQPKRGLNWFGQFLQFSKPAVQHLLDFCDSVLWCALRSQFVEDGRIAIQFIAVLLNADM